jgi:hypothetical protein
MTARFKDQEQFADRDEAEAARLLAALSPSELDPVLEDRVYARLMAQPERTVQDRQHGQRRWVVACVGLLLVSVTILAATLVTTLVQRWLGPSRSASTVSPVSTTELRVLQRPAGEPANQIAGPMADQASEASAAQSGGASPPAVALPGAPAPSHPVPAGTMRRRSTGAVNLAAKPAEAAAAETLGPAAETASGDARMAAAPSEEAAMVLAALRALRRGHDPVKAGALLDQYLARFPRGMLVEEALALGMEAARDRKDAAAATGLAVRYKQLYPAGRFIGLAQQVMGSNTP